MNLFRLLLVLSLSTLTPSQHYYITPTTAECKTSTPCLTLDQVLQHGPLVSGNNLTLIFQPGRHTLTQPFIIWDFLYVQMIGQDATSCIITGFHDKTGIKLYVIETLRIVHLTFIQDMHDKITVFPQAIVTFQVGDLSITNCYFTGLSTQDGENGSIINVYNTTKSVTIDSVVFEGNIGTPLRIIGTRAHDIAENSSNTEPEPVSLKYCTFSNNSAINGGGIEIILSDVSITQCNFNSNSAFSPFAGGGISVLSSSVSISHCNFTANTNTVKGGGVYVQSGSVSITHCNFTANTAKFGGGLAILSSVASVSDTIFTHNAALKLSPESSMGGGIAVFTSSIVIHNSTLVENTAYSSGGGIHIQSSSALVTQCVLTGNTAGENESSPGGGGILVSAGSLTMTNSSFVNNRAPLAGGLSLLETSASISHTNFTSNQAKYDGGAIYAHQCPNLHLNSTITISNSTAGRAGGGIFIMESTLFISTLTAISHNRAAAGGAIFSFQSTLEFNHTKSMIANNIANNGGGIYLSASAMKIGTFLCLEHNQAQDKGGGFYLQWNSRLYIQKKESQDILANLTISDNKAQFGGGIYVDDSSAAGTTCKTNFSNYYPADILGQCFLQTLTYYIFVCESHDCNTINTFITNNTAIQSGSAIYGGLLDRCIVPANTDLPISKGLDYINRTVEVPDIKRSISSEPVQVKLCDGSQKLTNVFARKGQPFKLHLEATDQAENLVNAIIHCSIITESGVGRLKEGQVEQSIGNECTELEYNVFSQDSSAQVELYAIGPCSNIGISRVVFNVTFLDCLCLLGLHPTPSQIECRCECDQELHAKKCFFDKGTFQLEIGKWIGTTEFTECNETGYILHDCPFDYCVDQPVNVSLNSSQEIDRQCAYNRSGVLCGECNEELSLVLASSRCMECSNIYLLLLIPFAVAGIALVAFILMLNITIATGTTYGLILYANILAANKAIFFPFTTQNFLTVFISWVNLDLGIETCFYGGMSSQAKVLLQIVFPAYLFLLIFFIIILSNYINLFAKLLSNRNPVAALCTLLLLSYSKLLRLIIAALQFTFLDCPDASTETVWYYNANIKYFSLSHIPRFVAASIILIACMLFTTLLFFGQCFLRCSNWRIMKWTKNTKYIGFMDAFHAPFSPKHRYWPGLLLFALIVHNLVASMAQDTLIPVLSAGSIALGLIVYKSLMNRIYKDKLSDAFETFFLLNMGALAYGTLTINGQQVLASVSVTIAFVLFLVITCYHFYKYVLKKTNVWNNNFPNVNRRRFQFNFWNNRNYRELVEEEENVDVELPPIVERYSNGYGPREETDPDKYITPPIIRPATRPDQLREPALDILAPVTEDDYRQAAPMPQAENNHRPVVTTTVVEINR